MGKIEQYGTLVIGLMIAGGFAFGGIASFAGLISTSGGGSGQQQNLPQLPDVNFKEGSFGYGLREEGYLANTQDVVFLTGVYSTQGQREKLDFLRQMPSRFNGRVYVQVVNESNATPIVQDFGIVEYPQVVAVGGRIVARGGRRTFYTDTVTQVSRSAVRKSVCNGFKNLGSDLAAKCL